MQPYEKPELLSEETEDVCVDVHSSGLGMAIVGSIILSLVWPPIEAS